MKIEIHVLQNFAPSNLNRDQDNAPKNCFFGDVSRARISSQCLKRSVRDFFTKYSLTETGTRTKRLKMLLTKKLETRITNPEQLSGILDVFIKTFYTNYDSEKPNETNVLIFVGTAEVEAAAKIVEDNFGDLLSVFNKQIEWQNKQDAAKQAGKETKSGTNKDKMPEWTPKDVIKAPLSQARQPADIALFGRMLAGKPGHYVDAACQVSHAISTHQVDQEMDFYTAIDDEKNRSDERNDNKKEDAGAGMLGIINYSSACYYRYALIDREQLAANIEKSAATRDYAAADKMIEAFLEAFVQAIPTGKQNSMAAQNRPSLGLFVVRDKGVPCSLANAFVRPVRPPAGSDLVEASKTAMAHYFERMNQVYDLYEDSDCALFHDGTEAPQELSGYDKGSLRKAIAATMQAISKGAQA